MKMMMNGMISKEHKNEINKSRDLKKLKNVGGKSRKKYENSYDDKFPGVRHTYKDPAKEESFCY